MRENYERFQPHNNDKASSLRKCFRKKGLVIVTAQADKASVDVVNLDENRNTTHQLKISSIFFMIQSSLFEFMPTNLTQVAHRPIQKDDKRNFQAGSLQKTLKQQNKLISSIVMPHIRKVSNVYEVGE